MRRRYRLHPLLLPYRLCHVLPGIARWRQGNLMENNILETIDPKELGKRLQQARKGRGLTQEAVAQLVDMARTTLVAIEKGERRVKAGELISLARVYGQQIGDFVRPRPQV